MSGKQFWDCIAFGTLGATIAGWLPPLAALFTLIWSLIQIYESKTFKRFMTWVKS